MKKLFISFVLLFSLFIFSQEYQFDYMLKSTVKRDNPDYNYQSYDMVNSKNHNLYMEVGRNNINDNYYSILVDNDKKNVSRFNIIMQPYPCIFTVFFIQKMINEGRFPVSCRRAKQN